MEDFFLNTPMKYDIEIDIAYNQQYIYIELFWSIVNYQNPYVRLLAYFRNMASWCFPLEVINISNATGTLTAWKINMDRIGNIH